MLRFLLLTHFNQSKENKENHLEVEIQNGKLPLPRLSHYPPSPQTPRSLQTTISCRILPLSTRVFFCLKNTPTEQSLSDGTKQSGCCFPQSLSQDNCNTVMSKKGRRMDSFKGTAGYGKLAVLCFPKEVLGWLWGQTADSLENTDRFPIPPAILQVTPQRDGV